MGGLDVIDALFVTDWYSETGDLLEREAAPAIKTGDGALDSVAADAKQRLTAALAALAQED